MKFHFIILVLFIITKAHAQSDFILLKDKKKAIATYFSGSNISFVTTTGASIDATISKIKNDTLFLVQHIVKQIPTTMGFYILDTIGAYRYQFHFHQIKSILTTGRHFNWAQSGSFLLGGGTILTLANGIVYLADKEKFSLPFLLSSVSFAGIGYLLSKKGNRGMQIGKRYTLNYINTVQQGK
jgi:hypothetical protein